MPAPRDPSSRWILLGVVLGLCAVTLTPAQAASTHAVSHKDENFITADTPGILDIEAGECFTDPAYHPAAAARVVLYTVCTQQADNQSYGFVHLPDGPFDHDRVAEDAWTRCGKGFRTYWPTEKSTLDYYPILPTMETWADGDRDVMCVVYDPTGQLTDSVLPKA
ncbi:hypothetical protein [Actinophytocola sediminis]